MLKSAGTNLLISNAKKGSEKKIFVGALESGLNRRAFLRQSSIAILFSGIAACKPSIQGDSNGNNESIDSQPEKKSTNEIFEFTSQQQETLETVQMKLFPDDGDGPSAKQINALDYLQWTLTDPDNLSDGDGEFIVKGIGWLDSLSEQTQGTSFIKLKEPQQNKILTQISQSSAGENWLSILIYYLMEALLFDPIYGGNPDQIGWKWLKHQPGFPRPTEQTRYRKFV